MPEVTVSSGAVVCAETEDADLFGVEPVEDSLAVTFGAGYLVGGWDYDDAGALVVVETDEVS